LKFEIKNLQSLFVNRGSLVGGFYNKLRELCGYSVSSAVKKMRVVGREIEIEIEIEIELEKEDFE